MSQEELISQVSSLRESLESSASSSETTFTIGVLAAIEASLKLNMIEALHKHVSPFAWKLIVLCDREVEKIQSKS